MEKHRTARRRNEGVSKVKGMTGGEEEEGKVGEQMVRLQAELTLEETGCKKQCEAKTLLTENIDYADGRTTNTTQLSVNMVCCCFPVWRRKPLYNLKPGVKFYNQANQKRFHVAVSRPRLVVMVT